MARVAVVAYPVVDRADLEGIQSVRDQYDPLASRIAPHFTLVFPIDAQVDVTGEVARVTAHHAPITFVLESAIAMPDVVHGGAHVFLVPGEGRDQIALLHDELYAGALRAHLREDAPFVPHLTIAHGDARWCEDHAERLSRTLCPVRGVIDALTLVDVTAANVESLARFALGPALRLL